MIFVCLFTWKNNKRFQRYGAICGAECITSNQLVANRLSPALLEDNYHQFYGKENAPMRHLEYSLRTTKFFTD